MVDADNVAWHAQSGNPITIGIEFSPHLNAEGYKRGGWLISELEKRYKRTLALYPHSKFHPTACPGSISLTKLRQEANNFKEGDEMVDKDQLNVLYRFYLGIPASDHGKKNYLGKKTFAQVQELLQESNSFQTKLFKAGAGTLDTVVHLPVKLRNAHVAPVPPEPPKATSLKKGLYEVL
jgi:hypothetical protein